MRKLKTTNVSVESVSPEKSKPVDISFEDLMICLERSHLLKNISQPVRKKK